MMHNATIALLLALAAPTSAVAQFTAPTDAPDGAAAIAAFAQASTQPVAPAATDRAQDFVDLAILSPSPYVLALGVGVVDQATGFSAEWTGNKGFGQRTLARVATGLAADGVGHSLAAALRHQVRYEPCICNGSWNRTTHALAWGFVTRHDNGDMVMHTSLFASKFAAAGLANAWYPASYTGKDVLRQGALGVGLHALVNVAREYAPELKRLVGIR